MPGVRAGVAQTVKPYALAIYGCALVLAATAGTIVFTHPGGAFLFGAMAVTMTLLANELR